MEKCICHRGWPIQSKKHQTCRACEWERKNDGESFEENQNQKNRATQARMLDKQLAKQKEKQQSGLKPYGNQAKQYISKFAGVAIELDEDYARTLDREQEAKKASRQPKKVSKPNKPIRSISKQGAIQMQRDEETYDQVWSQRKDDCCEECGAYIGSELRNEKGKIVDKFRFSHILSKAAWPEFRNEVINFNLLCLICHGIWETGDNITRQSMKVWSHNKAVILELQRMKIEREAQQLNRFED